MRIAVLFFFFLLLWVSRRVLLTQIEIIFKKQKKLKISLSSINIRNVSWYTFLHSRHLNLIDVNSALESLPHMEVVSVVDI
jgi:hypothetical protein